MFLILILRNCIKSIQTIYLDFTIHVDSFNFFKTTLLHCAIFKEHLKKNYSLVNSHELTRISLSKLNREIGAINYNRLWRIIKFFFSINRSQCFYSLERRWSSRRFSYGYLVTTSPQSSIPPSAAGSITGYLTDFGCYQLSWCDGRCVQGPGTYSPRHADSRLLATPASCRRVAAYNPNWDEFLSLAPPCGLASLCTHHCSTCVALDIRGMMIWRHPHLPPG